MGLCCVGIVLLTDHGMFRVSPDVLCRAYMQKCPYITYILRMGIGWFAVIARPF